MPEDIIAGIHLDLCAEEIATRLLMLLLPLSIYHPLPPVCLAVVDEVAPLNPVAPTYQTV